MYVILSYLLPNYLLRYVLSIIYKISLGALKKEEGKEKVEGAER